MTAPGLLPQLAPRLYLVTDRRATGGRPLGDVVAAALGAPAVAAAPAWTVAVQLREKDLDGRALAALARELRDVTSAARAALYVNGRADVALAAGADGVHLGGGALSPADVARVGPGLAVAISTHAPAEVAEVAKVATLAAAGLRFAVFGPVWDTPSKRALGVPVGVEALRAAARATPELPLLALGGVTPARAAACLRAGASGVACIRAVMAAPDPARAVEELLASLAPVVAAQPVVETQKGKT